MAVFKWIGTTAPTSGTHYQTASNLTDLTTGTTGVTLPGPGDTINITGIADSEIYRIGALYTFPVDTAFTQVLFFKPQNPITTEDNPDALVGDTDQGQTFNIDGTAGVVDLWLQNSYLLNDTLNVTGTVVASAYLDSTISGAITIGTPTQHGTLQIEPIAADTALIAPSDHHPVTTLDSNIVINGGSTLDIEVGTSLVTGVISNGVTTVAPGGTLFVDDEDDQAGAASPVLANFDFNNNLLFANGGTINLQGAAGQTTRAVFLADVAGSGTININGNGAAASATSLLIDGSFTNQNIVLADGTVTVDDASTNVEEPDDNGGFDVTGGGFTFADGKGVLVLRQASLTTLQFTADDSQEVQTPDGRDPFTTPITGFQTGDVIEFPGKNLAGFGLGNTYVTVYNAATHLLQIESPDSIAGNPPEIIAALTFNGQYTASDFHLSGNNATEELDLTYAGAPPPWGPQDPLVNAAYIDAERPDVAAAGVDPTLWYDTFGWKEGTNPNPYFDTNYYLSQNPDIRAAGVNPLQHFEAFGWKEGRDPSLLFSDSKYLAANPDVAAAGMDPLLHYEEYGHNEGRIAFLTGGAAPADPLVNTAYYDAQLGATLIPTGTAAAQQAAYSYETTGWTKGLNPDAFFNTQYYLSHNPDVAAAHIDPLLHYETSGWHEGRNPSAQFSTNKYLAAYADVKAAGIDPLLHYVEYGQAEGRTAFAV